MLRSGLVVNKISIDSNGNYEIHLSKNQTSLHNFGHVKIIIEILRIKCILFLHKCYNNQ